MTATGDCVECVPDCNKCSGDSIAECSECVKGFFLENGKCVKCVEDCVECDSADYCLSCSSHTYLSEDSSQCLTFCNRPCLECTFSSGIEECSECIAGYKLVNEKCVADVSCNTNQEC